MMTTIRNSTTSNHSTRVAGSLLLAALAFSAPATQAKEGDAEAILKSMTQYVAKQKTIELTFDSDIEVVTPLLEKIQFTNSGEVLLSRPDKLRAHRIGGYADVDMVFDGKTLSILGKNINGYIQRDAPGTVDQMFNTMHNESGLVFPGADLLQSDAYNILMAGVLEAKHIGRGVIDGKECEHLAFRNFDTDWQLWVQVGDKPIPCKMVVTSKTVNDAPQYTLRIKNWKTDVTPSAEAFTFTPPTGAQKLGMEAMSQLDELPPSAPASPSAGEKK